MADCKAAAHAAGAGFNTRRTGWTVGGGVETKLYGIGGAAFNNWSFKAECLYVNLGNAANPLWRQSAYSN